MPKLELHMQKVSALDGRTYAYFTQIGSTEKEPFTITVTPSGFSFSGKMTGEIEDQVDLSEFARIIGDVIWKTRLGLKKDKEIRVVQTL